MGKTQIILEIEFCNDCPFSATRRVQVGLSTGDDYLFDWHCTKNANEKIEGCVDADEKIKIPKFCPFKIIE